MFRRSVLLGSLLIFLSVGFGFSGEPWPAGEKQVCVTKYGRSFHAPECRYLSGNVRLMAMSKASRRYKACNVCKPDVRDDRYTVNLLLSDATDTGR